MPTTVRIALFRHNEYVREHALMLLLIVLISLNRKREKIEASVMQEIICEILLEQGRFIKWRD